MQSAHEMSSRRPSAFIAAFLSLLFPGLGHVYLGAHRRALGFAAPPILIGALAAGIAVRLGTFQLAGVAIQSWFLVGIFVVNLVALVYRAAAIIDAWRIATWISTGRGSGPFGVAVGSGVGIASIAGLAAVLVVMSGVHVAVARYDSILAGTTACIFDPEAQGCGSAPTTSASPATSSSTDEPLPSVNGTAPPSSVAPWDGKSRLNILLLGADEQGGAHNTDTMITVSIDPTTNQVVMFTLPRDMVDIPVPAGPARAVFGPVYRGKINSFYSAASRRPDLYPGSDRTRGYAGLKSILGELYGLDIKYYVEVNFEGFKQVVDALGGVTIDVQFPVVEDHYPVTEGDLMRLYIPAGVQHMTGAEALPYARSRHGSSDFDRGARQQRLLLSLRQQTDPAQILPRIDALAEALKQSIRTDLPRELLPQLLGIAQRVGARDIRSVIFTPPFFGTEVQNSPRGYIIEPAVDRIRQAISEAFTVDPAFATRRQALVGEGASVWVLDGARQPAAAVRLAAYLSYLGMDASAPSQKPDTSGLPTTTIRAYNGAETRFPQTAATLAAVLGVAVTPATDPSVTADFAVITSRSTPGLTPPPGP